MKIITPNLLILIIGLGISGCQAGSQRAQPIIEVIMPGIVRRMEGFQERIKKNQLFLEITVSSQEGVIWNQQTPADFSKEIELPAKVFEDYEEKPVTILVEVWDRPTNSIPTCLLLGSREMDGFPIKIYLSLTKPLTSKDLVEEFGFD